MANFFRLVKVQFLGLFGINKRANSKKKMAKLGQGGFMFTLLIIAVAVAGFGYIYSDIFAMSLIAQDKLNMLVPLMIGVSALLSFLLSFYSVGSAIFGFKDYDMLSSLPIKPLAIVLSKFFFIYIVDVAFCVLLSTPALVVTVMNAGAPTGMQIASLLVACLVSPLLPLSLATVVGMLVYYISSKFKRKNVVQTIVLIIFSVALFSVSFLSGFIDEENMASFDLTGIIGKIYFLFTMLVDSGEDLLSMLAFIGVNLGSALLVVTFVCAFYKKLNGVFTAKRTARNYKLKEYTARGVDRTLFSKELKRLFSCPVYAVNSLMGAVLAVLMCAGYCILYLTLKTDVGDEQIINEVFALLNRLLPTIFAFMFLMTPTTVPSISLEGQAFWVLKTAPVPVSKIFRAKLRVNTLFCGLPALVCSVALGICTGMPVYDLALFVVTAVAISQFGGAFGLIMNLRFPKMKWDNETQPVKQGLPTLFTVLSAFVGAVLLGLAGGFLPVSNTALFGIFAGLFVGLSVVMHWLLFSKGEKMFNKIQ